MSNRKTLHDLSCILAVSVRAALKSLHRYRSDVCNLNYQSAHGAADSARPTATNVGAAHSRAETVEVTVVKSGQKFADQFVIISVLPVRECI